MPQALYMTLSFLFVFLLTLCVVAIIAVIVRPAPKLPRPPVQRLQLLGAKELVFYKELRAIADIAKLLVFAKVRVADLLKVERKNDAYKSWEEHAKSCCADFVLCEPGSFKTVLIIQLDDENRDLTRGEQWNRDILELCESAAIPALVVEDQSSGALEKALSQKIGAPIRGHVAAPAAKQD